MCYLQYLKKNDKKDVSENSFLTLFLMRVIKKRVTIITRYFMDYILRTFPNLYTFILPEHQIYYTYSFFFHF